jgi:hypothetical protein
MGLFRKDISGDSVTVQVFQTIAQAIDVVAQTGMDKNENFDVGDLWALYFWTIKPFEDNPQALNPYLYTLLKNSPGSPFSIENNSKSYQSPSKLIFPIHPDDYDLYVKVSMEIKDLLESKYLRISPALVDSQMEECGIQMERIIKAHLPTLYTISTPAVIFSLTLALRSILKDTHRINSATVERVRKKGFFYISMMATSWHFKADGQN